MRVFVTGSTGFIGTAVVQELIGAGHRVLGLVRSEEAARALTAAGGEPHFGAIDDLDSLRRGVAATNGVIHTAFIHDFSNFKASCEADRHAIEAMGEELVGTGKPLVVTSGVLLLQPGRVGTEDDSSPFDSSTTPRKASEEAADAVAAKGVRVSVIRLSPSVHGDGDHGFVPMLIGIAREKGIAAYIGEGNNRWPGVHKLDAARLYRLALEQNTTPGTRYHGVADEGVPTKDIAAIIGKKLNLPVVSLSPEEAAPHFTWMTYFFSIDGPASSKLTRERLGWEPTHAGLIDDLENGTYF